MKSQFKYIIRSTESAIVGFVFFYAQEVEYFSASGLIK